MTVKALTEIEKHALIQQYNNKVFLFNKDLAANWKISPRTLNRILQEYALATPVERLKDDAHAVMQLLKQYGIQDAKGLAQVLAMPAVTPQTVQTYLNQSSREHLADLFSQAWTKTQPTQPNTTFDERFVLAA